MQIVLLKFGERKSEAPQYMSAHKEWLQRGFDDRVFLLAGSLQPGLGGLILVSGCSLAALGERVAQDPFVVEGIVTSEILNIEPSRMDERLRELLA